VLERICDVIVPVKASQRRNCWAEIFSIGRYGHNPKSNGPSGYNRQIQSCESVHQEMKRDELSVTALFMFIKAVFVEEGVCLG
jgi:hypothetical protein